MISQITYALIIPLGHQRLSASNSSLLEEGQSHSATSPGSSVSTTRAEPVPGSTAPCQAQTSLPQLSPCPHSPAPHLLNMLHSQAMPLFPLEGGSRKLCLFGIRQLTARKLWSHSSEGEGSSSRHGVPGKAQFGGVQLLLKRHKAVREQGLSCDLYFWGSGSPFLQLSRPAGHSLDSGALA